MKNSLILGILIGLLAPFIAFLLVKIDATPAFFDGKPAGMYVVAATINLLLVRYFYRNDGDRLGQGIVIATFLGVILLMFNKHLLSL